MVQRVVKAGFLIAVFIVGTVGIFNQMHRKITIPAEAYTPLLETIAKGESSGNYNAYFGNGGNTTIRFTEMPVSEVLKWQDEFVRQGNYSNAVGRYQIIRPTLLGLVKQQDIDLGARFDEAMQDRLAIKLLERRGSLAYVDKALTRKQFAANLAKEWAALPKVIGENPEQSYYSDDGVNKSRITIDEVLQALANLEIKGS
jgi:conjugal transfer mating pair stabilization protein TraG